MKSLELADTSGFFSAYVQTDRFHDVTVQAFKRDTRLITTRSVVMETVSLLSKRISPFHARQWYELLHKDKALEILEWDKATYKEAEQVWKKHRDKAWDLIDCYSMAVMYRLKIKFALTYDHHFSQAGFETLLDSVS